ncbi:uncharacterized protein LOC114385962 [Glycine soja]|uniref:uncharacterized protein LOC114385962 n=1 Tax=Glycine soja TaxID=3848 RepID=UPI00103C3B68|nr:uncharacterized protein LOC114385962 [Glycine soja]
MDFMVTLRSLNFLEMLMGRNIVLIQLNKYLVAPADSFLGSFWIEGHIASWLNNLFAKFDIAEATKVKTKVMSTVATRWRQFKSTLTSKFVFAKTEGQQTQDVVTKYGLDPEAWKQFEETRLTPNWEDSLEEQVTQGSFVPHGRQDILNTAIGRPDHGGRVRAAGSGVTITQYYGRASRTCSSSSTSISQQQLDEVVARLREDMTELSNKGSQEALQIQPDIQQLGARVSTQGSNAVTNAQASQEHDADAIPLMGLFVQRNDGTQRLVAMGKIMEGDSIIHTVAYADDVVRVSVETVIDPEAEVPYATSEIQYVKQAVNTFVAWPTHLVKAVLDEHPQRIPHNEDAHVPKPANVNADDPLRELMKYSFDLYDKPLQISFDGRFLGIVDASTSIFITYSDVIEIIAGDKSLNISVIQLWLMYIHEWSQIFSQGFMYAFLEPQSLVCSKDRRSECEQYLERWLKESDREVYIGPYFHQ